MIVSAVVAAAHNNVIGKNNELPWRLPADLRRFKELTLGHAVIMGRKTLESIGRPLPERQNIVVTHDPALVEMVGVLAVASFDAALQAAQGDEVFVIGGAQIYREAMPRLDRIYMTEVDADIEGDTFFPELKPGDWREVSRERHTADDRNQYDYAFVTLERT